jgi:RNA polymerase sigma factor (sigma-70 family)
MNDATGAGGGGAAGQGPLGARGDLDDLLELARRVAHAAARRVPLAVARIDAPSDLAQSVVRELLKNADRLEYRGDADFAGLARSILRRKVTEKLRRALAQRRDGGRDAQEPEAEPAAEDPSPSRQAAAAELERLLGALLDRLPAREREVLHRRMQGQTHEVIAAALGITRVNSEQLLSRARAKIREALEARGG